jgi:hypothetical protein
MHEQHGMRRVVLAALMVMVALATVGANTPSAADHKRPDFGSAEGFRLECELLGGTYSEDGIGNTNCHYPDGTWTQCDANGNDCWVTPPRRRPPSAWQEHPDVVGLGEVTTDVGRPSVGAPEYAGQILAVAAHDQKADRAKHGKGKHGKGKKRKK